MLLKSQDVLDTIIQKQTQITNKTPAHLQKHLGAKIYRRTSQHGNKNVKKHNRSNCTTRTKQLKTGDELKRKR
jgi:hypothetical protein